MAALLFESVPSARYRCHQKMVDTAVCQVMRSGTYILGEQTERFETEFAGYVGVSHCIGVGSGTDALEIALRSCGVEAGDGVITVSHTAVATVAAISRIGAKTIMVDIDPVTYTMDPNYVEDVIRDYRANNMDATYAPLKAIVPVHLYGHPADMTSLMKIAGEHGLMVVEDCAQSHGARLNGRKTGQWGDMAAFSFYPTKNLGGFGDGGAIATGHSELAEKARLLRQYGWRIRQVSSIQGYNSRLDELQSGILRVLLGALDIENEKRQWMAQCYAAAGLCPQLENPMVNKDAYHVYHQYVVRSKMRNELKMFFESQNVPVQIHYPAPVHLQPAYKGQVWISRKALHHSESASREVLSLPMSPYLSHAAVDLVCRLLRQWKELNG